MAKKILSPGQKKRRAITILMVLLTLVAAAVVAVNEWFGSQHQARGQALYGSISFGAGGMMGGVLSGYTWDWIGSAWTYSLGAVFALLGLLVLVGGWREPSPGERV